MAEIAVSLRIRGLTLSSGTHNLATDPFRSDSYLGLIPGHVSDLIFEADRSHGEEIAPKAGVSITQCAEEVYFPEA